MSKFNRKLSLFILAFISFALVLFATFALSGSSEAKAETLTTAAEERSAYGEDEYDGAVMPLADDQSGDAATDGGQFDWWIWLLVGASGALVVVIVVLAIVLIRKHNQTDDDGLPKEIVIIRSEEVVEKAEEPEGEAVEELAEEPEPAEEQTAEEAEKEPEPAEEPSEEPAEEEAVEEPAEEPEESVEVASEEAVADELAYENAEPEPAEAADYEPVTTSEPADYEPVTTAEVEESEAFVPIVTEEGRTVLDKSFSARLSQADDGIKRIYIELKNDILAYKGVKSRVSWYFDSFNKGRTRCVRLQLRGKSLYMYIALEPAELDPKYHVKDVSAKSRYRGVPAMLKLKSGRSLKYAKQLVAILMENLGAERGNTPNGRYKTAYRSTQSLIRDGLIKIKTTKSTFAAPKNSGVPQDGSN